MPDTDDIPRRRHVLLLDVTQTAAEVIGAWVSD
jgi:hypothetical protein